jgi:hypothetical protein
MTHNTLLAQPTIKKTDVIADRQAQEKEREHVSTCSSPD